MPIVDWETYLLEAHKQTPGMTPQAFGFYRSADGLNSYEELLKSLDGLPPGAKSVMDLACGDGHLVTFILKKIGPDCRISAVDMSQHELNLAREKLKAYSNIEFFLENAKQLSHASASQDAILCHLAFMLMTPIAPVIHELRRVLRPGGVFSAVVGRSEPVDDIFAELQAMIQGAIDSNLPAARRLEAGDARTRTLGGLKELFNSKTGFEDEIEVEDFDLLVQDSPQENWKLWRHMYFVSMLSEEKRSELRAQIQSFLHTKMDRSGKVSFKFPLKRFVVKKLG